MEHKLLLTRGSGRVWGRAKPTWSKEAQTINTCQRDRKLPTLSQSNDKCKSNSLSIDEARVDTSHPKPVEAETEASNMEVQNKAAEVETEHEDANMINHKDPQIWEAVKK